MQRRSPFGKRGNRWLRLAAGLAAAVAFFAHAKASEADAMPSLKFSDFITSAQKADSASRLKPLDDLDLNYTKTSTAVSAEAIARGQRAGEDMFKAGYERPLGRDLALQMDGSLKFPQDNTFNETGVAQGSLAMNSLTTRAVYAGTDSWSLKPFYSHSMWNYQERSAAMTNDHAVSSLGLDADWQVTRRTKFTSGLQTKQVDYTLSASSYRAEIGSFGIEQQLTGKLKAGASIGTEMREEITGKNVVNPSNDLNLSYTLPYDATLTVGRRQSIQENYLPDFYEDLTEAYYSRLSQRVSPNLQLSTSAALEFAGRNSTLSSVQSTYNECWQFQVAPTYQLREDLSAQLGYSLKVYTVPALSNQSTDNCIFLSLKFTY